MRAYMICHKPNGFPDFSSGGEQLPRKAFTLAAMAGDWGLYLVAGTSGQLTAINALDTTVGICTLADLQETVASAVADAIDAWAAEHFPSLPAVPRQTRPPLRRQLAMRSLLRHVISRLREAPAILPATQCRSLTSEHGNP